MKTYEFAIIASGLDHTAEDFESRFYDAGCDDALVSFQKGAIIIDFAREARSVEDAIESAVRDVALSGATIEHIEPDPLVSLADIAERCALSRAAMSQYAKGQRGKDFPAPVARITTSSPLWEWSSVCRWLFDKHRISKQAVLEAEAVRVANEAIEAGDGDVGPRVRLRVRELEAQL